MKRTSSYKMPKTLKTMLALMPFYNAEEKARFKKRMIDAQIQAEHFDRGRADKSKREE